MISRVSTTHGKNENPNSRALPIRYNPCTVIINCFFLSSPNHPHVGKYAIHAAYGNYRIFHLPPIWDSEYQ